jgi:hypothetical protein
VCVDQKRNRHSALTHFFLLTACHFTASGGRRFGGTTANKTGKGHAVPCDNDYGTEDASGVRQSPVALLEDAALF